MSAAEEGARLRTLLEEWREPGPLQRVRSRDVCPDCTNREQTLLSVEHVHYIARKMALEGFRRARSARGVAALAYRNPQHPSDACTHPSAAGRRPRRRSSSSRRAARHDPAAGSPAQAARPVGGVQ